MRVAFFGQFDGGNSGAESSLRTILRRLQRLYADPLETCRSPADQRAGGNGGGRVGEVRRFR